MKKITHVGIIRNNIGMDYNGIPDVEQYRGRCVFLKLAMIGDNYKYRGKLPNDNNCYLYGWTDKCFSSVMTIEEWDKQHEKTI